MSEPFFYSDIESAKPFFTSHTPSNSPPPFTTGRLLWHLALLVITGITTTLSGAIFPLLLRDIELVDIISMLGSDYTPIINGLVFSFTLLTILGTHELGHYIACRYYNVRATLPYFIPVPPPLGIGTLGAFIRIKSPIYTRRALFDIGISGPLTGFVFALPAAVVGIYYGKPLTTPVTDLPIYFHHPLLFALIAKLTGHSATVEWNPIWFACWVGMLATALNLLPVGQLDGGHVVYALFGRRGHRFVAVFITLLQAAVAYFAYTRYNWSGGFVYAAMLVLMLILRHPRVVDETAPLDLTRKILGIVALLVFILSFMPVPLRIN
ncbi:MAG: site-2 protease family protein [Acidobacteriota bacterium]